MHVCAHACRHASVQQHVCAQTCVHERAHARACNTRVGMRLRINFRSHTQPRSKIHAGRATAQVCAHVCVRGRAATQVWFMSVPAHRHAKHVWECNYVLTSGRTQRHREMSALRPLARVHAHVHARGFATACVRARVCVFMNAPARGHANHIW
jgi:hypothetical protein